MLFHKYSFNFFRFQQSIFWGVLHEGSIFNHWSLHYQPKQGTGSYIRGTPFNLPYILALFDPPKNGKFMETPERNSTCLFSWVTLARASSKCIKHSVLSQAAAKYNGVAPFLEAKFTSARSLPDSQAAFFADGWNRWKVTRWGEKQSCGKKTKTKQPVEKS